MAANLVSILIPFKNTAKYLPECVASIIEQSYTNWEAILVDDHSSDSSLQIINSFASQDSRIKVLPNLGDGIIHALRTAYNESIGTYVTRMDSDDVMAVNKLESLVKCLETYGKGNIALGLVKYFSEDKISVPYQQYEGWLNTLTRKGNNLDEIYKECVIASPCWMLHKDDLDRCGAFNHDVYPEDYDLVFRFYEQGYKCIPNTELLHYWRDYPSRTSKIHEHYELERFIKLKVHYFLKLDHQPESPLTVWGAGNTGKLVAKELINKGILFHWISENPHKFGKQLFGKKMESLTFFENLNGPQSIIAVANENSQKQIHQYFNNRKMAPMKDYFMFC